MKQMSILYITYMFYKFFVFLKFSVQEFLFGYSWLYTQFISLLYTQFRYTYWFNKLLVNKSSRCVNKPPLIFIKNNWKWRWKFLNIVLLQNTYDRRKESLLPFAELGLLPSLWYGLSKAVSHVEFLGKNSSWHVEKDSLSTYTLLYRNVMENDELKDVQEDHAVSML